MWLTCLRHSPPRSALFDEMYEIPRVHRPYRDNPSLPRGRPHNTTLAEGLSVPLSIQTNDSGFCGGTYEPCTPDYLKASMDSGFFDGGSSPGAFVQAHCNDDLDDGYSSVSNNHVNSPAISLHPESETDDYLERLFEENQSFTTVSLYTSTNSQRGSDPEYSDQTPPSSLFSSGLRVPNNPSSNKRRRASDEDEEENSQNRRKKPKRDSDGIWRKEEQSDRRLACHFHLFDPQEYCKNIRTGKTYETCSGPGWATMHHLK